MALMSMADTSLLVVLAPAIFILSQAGGEVAAATIPLVPMTPGWPLCSCRVRIVRV